MWVAAIVIIVAGILYLTQKQAPAGENDQDANMATNTAPTVVDVPATVSFSYEPTSVPVGAIFGVDWQVETSEQTYATETAIYWDMSSHPGDFDTSTAPSAAGYKNHTTTYSTGYFALPGPFEDNIKTDDGDAGKVLYMRAYVALAGKHYWSKEIAVPVKARSAGGGS